MFPGDTEGLQILEHSCLLGTPNEDELKELSSLIQPQLITLLRKIGPLPRQNFMEILKVSKYSEREKEQGIDLILKMTKWVPHQRISARDAMNHPFLSDVQI